MTILQALLMGIIQGLSEFLPISSSAHIIFTSNFYKVMTGVEHSVASQQEVFFDIMLHFGTLIAVFIFFRKEIWDILKAFCKAIVSRDFSDKNAKIAVYILIGTFFTCLLAFPLKDFTETLVSSPRIVALLLIVTGFVLFLSEYMSKNFKTKTDKLTLKHAIIIGIAQGLAVFPGFSRSGWTIASGLFAGLDRVTCTKYSFLLVAPIILGSSILYPILEIHPNDLVSFNWIAILVGTFVSAVVGYFCIKYFLKFVAKFTLNFFAYYCLIAGVLVFAFFTVV